MNMKYLKIFAVSLLSASALVSCESQLDVENMGGYVSSEEKQKVVEAIPERIDASVAGVPAALNQYMLFGTRHNDFGYPSIMLMLDHRGQDLVGLDVGYNWYSYYEDYSDVDYSYYMVNLIWQPLYKQVKAANEITALIPSDTPDDALKFDLAQGLAFRAFAYFNLAQLFQFTYKGHETDPCVPLITEANADAAAANGCARSTVQEVYDQIMSDLNTAVTLLSGNPTVRADKRYVDECVVRGLRARVELVMNDWDAAAADAQYVIANSGATPLSQAEASVPGFNDLAAANMLWGVLIEETDRVVTSGIVNFPSHMGSLCYGYSTAGAWRKVNVKLYNSIPATDVRKNWFLDASKKSAGLTTAQQAYVTQNGAPAYTQVKFAPYGGVVGTSTNASDVPLMRIEEMYLILAEAQAMGSAGASTGAATLQSFVSTYRDPSYTFSGASATAVQEEVWQQRRVELYGEGQSYFDSLRLNKGIDRRGGGYDEAYVFVIPAGDPCQIYPIPMSEINANPLISESDNNPTASQPKPVADN